MSTTEITASAPQKSMLTRLGIDRLSALYLAGAFIVIFGIWKPNTFLSVASAKLILSENVAIGLLALAFLVPLATNYFDLSIGAMTSLSLCITTWLSDDFHRSFNMPACLAALCGVLACTLFGVLSGFIVVKLKVN